MKYLARVGGKICFAKPVVSATIPVGNQAVHGDNLKNWPLADIETAQAAIKYIAVAMAFAPAK